MKNRNWQVVTLAILVSLTLAAAPADAANWELLGTRKADFRADHDVIAVSGAEGRFTRIKLEVRGNGIELRDLKVVFGDGGVQDVEVRRHLAPGQSTRVIELAGGPRVVRKVTFWYRSQRRPRGRATVRLLGRKAVIQNVDASTGPDVAAGDGWRSIGSRSVGLRGDHDVIPVTAAEGSFDRIRLRVTKNGVEIRRLVVHFGSGGTQEIALTKYIAAGQSTRAVDLVGDERVINRIELWYRARPPRSGQARIVVLAEYRDPRPAALPGGPPATRAGDPPRRASAHQRTRSALEPDRETRRRTSRRLVGSLVSNAYAGTALWP